MLKPFFPSTLWGTFAARRHFAAQAPTNDPTNQRTNLQREAPFQPSKLQPFNRKEKSPRIKGHLPFNS
jgi:hypothetical protein